MAWFAEILMLSSEILQKATSLADSLSQVAVICPHTSRAKRSWVQHQSCFSCAKSRNSTKLQVANLDQNSKTLNFLDPIFFQNPQLSTSPWSSASPNGQCGARSPKATKQKHSNACSHAGCSDF